MTKLSVDEYLQMVLWEEIRKEINNQILKAIADPDYIPQMSPVTYDSKETEEAHKLAGIETEKMMKELRKRYDEEGIDDDDLREKAEKYDSITNSPS